MPHTKIFFTGFVVVKFVSQAQQEIARNDAGVVVGDHVAADCALQVDILVE
jgi:hypothetical protein